MSRGVLQEAEVSAGEWDLTREWCGGKRRELVRRFGVIGPECPELRPEFPELNPERGPELGPELGPEFGPENLGGRKGCPLTSIPPSKMRRPDAVGSG
jgi:hypothetical protein